MDWIHFGNKLIALSHVISVQDDGRCMTVDLDNGNHFLITDQDEIKEARRVLGLDDQRKQG